MIRKALVADYPAILDMCAKFWLETMYNVPFDRDHTELMVETARDHGLLAVLEVDGKVEGFVAGVRGPLLANPNYITGTELAWWINPAHRRGRNGIYLMKFIEELAKEQGITFWNMISMQSSEPETANKIYERSGYMKSETSWTKRLQ